jgi:hypothetical protein
MVCRKRPQLPEPGLVLRPRIGRGGPVSQQLGHLGFRRKLVRLTQLHIRRDRLPAKAWILPGPAGAGSDEIAGSRRRGLLDRDRRNETGVAAHHPRRRTVTSCCLSGHRCCPGRNCRLIRWQHIGPHGRGLPGGSVFQGSGLATRRHKAGEADKCGTNSRSHDRDYSGLHQMVVMTWTKKARIKKG